MSYCQRIQIQILSFPLVVGLKKLLTTINLSFFSPIKWEWEFSFCRIAMRCEWDNILESALLAEKNSVHIGIELGDMVF